MKDKKTCFGKGNQVCFVQYKKTKCFVVIMLIVVTLPLAPTYSILSMSAEGADSKQVI